MKKLLIFSPHADDETLGAGGTLLKHQKEKDEIYWVNVTNAKIEYGYSAQEEEQGKLETERVAKQYGVKRFIDLQMEPAGLDKYRTSELVQKFADIVKEVQPQIIYLPFPYDVHTDHRIVFDAVYSCTKAFRYPSIEKVLCMEILSETDYAVSDKGFVPNYFVDISEFMEEKISIMKEYKNEIKPSPFPRNEDAIRGLAKYRAAACNVEYAEAFRVLKEIERM